MPINIRKQLRKSRTLQICYQSYVNLIRASLPIKNYATYNTINIPQEIETPIRYFEHFFPFYPESTKPLASYEEGIAHRKYTKEGDDVIIIGGGIGVSTVIAAKECGPSGNVIVFEPLLDHVNNIIKTVDLNNVSRTVDLVNKSVGSANIKSDDEIEIISSESLPECDVLEIDCEGTELEILNNLEIEPRIIIVEIHNGDAFHSEEIINLVNNLNYEIIGRLSRDWNQKEDPLSNSGWIDQNQFEHVLKSRDLENRSDPVPTPPVLVLKHYSMLK